MGKSKKKKGKKKRKLNVRKFKLDLFGILGFTRLFGENYEDFMCGKREKKPDLYHVKASKLSKKERKKRKHQRGAPDLPKFPELPPIPIKRVDGKADAQLDFAKDAILPYVDIGYQTHEKTTRPDVALQRAGSIRDVLCGPKFPLPPRPQPHGGVFGDRECPICRMMDSLFRGPYHELAPKLRKGLEQQFDKAQYIIEYLTRHAQEAINGYRAHLQGMMDILGPALDALDASEWDDHFEVKRLMDRWKNLQRELLRVKAEYRRLRDNQGAEIDQLLAEKRAEIEAAEQRLRQLEAQLKEAIDTLEDWRENHEKKIKEPSEEIERLLALLDKYKNAAVLERDYLRDLLEWETKLATEQTVAEMERIIAEDLNYIFKCIIHPAWFTLVLENRKLEEENQILSSENHLLDLEVETLERQVSQLVAQKKRFELTKTHGFRPPHLRDSVDRYLRNAGRLQLYEYPTTELLHE